MIRARSMQEYHDLIEQALHDVQELRVSIEFDQAFMDDALVFLDPLETEIRELHRAVSEGNYEFSKQNLPFMRIVYETPGSLLPFKQLLIRINDTHIHGLQTE
jgi:hypothetical protein